MMQEQLPPLAVLDWGIGGFGFIAALQKRYPGLPYAYLSDSGFTPYGRVGTAELATRLTQIGQYLQARGVAQLVIACNAASTVAPLATWPEGLGVSDILSAALAQMLAEPVAHLGIVGGKRTIQSQALAGPLRQAGRRVSQRVAQPLSAHIERGNLDGNDLLQDLDHILRPLRGVDALLLACTHYPAITPLFAQRLPGTRIIDPVHALLDSLTVNESQGANLPTRILTTGDAAALALGARVAFGLDLRAAAIRVIGTELT